MIGADLVVEADVVRMVDDAVRELDPLTGLVANAGAAPSLQRVADMSADRIDEVLTPNLRAAVHRSRWAARGMALRHGGSGGAIVLGDESGYVTGSILDVTGGR